jgi:C_GCAxxG_C_C family probable redox protein
MIAYRSANIVQEAGARAETFRKQGLSCSEAVLRGAAAALRVSVDASLLRASTGLRGGGGGYGDRCGALEGGALLVGLIYGRLTPEEDNTCASQLVRWLHERFVAEFGSTACRVLKPLSYAELSDDLSCGPVYRRGAELAAEAILGAPGVSVTCAPFDPATGNIDRMPAASAASHAAAGRIRTLAQSERLVITSTAREAMSRLGVGEEDLITSLAGAKRVRLAHGGHYVAEGRRADQWWLTAVVRVDPDAETAEHVEVIEVL